MKPPVQFVAVADRDGVMAIGRDDLIRYAGAEQIVASALCLRLFALAFADLSPAAPPRRDGIQVLVGFPGDGILDCVEMITRARTKGRLTIDTDAGPPHVPPALVGRFYWEIRIGDRACGYSLREGYFTPEFTEQVRRHQSGEGAPEELARYQQAKHALIGRLLGAAPDDLFERHRI
mgnify:CR=1 FL=1